MDYDPEKEYLSVESGDDFEPDYDPDVPLPSIDFDDDFEPDAAVAAGRDETTEHPEQDREALSSLEGQDDAPEGQMSGIFEGVGTYESGHPVRQSVETPNRPEIIQAPSPEKKLTPSQAKRYEEYVEHIIEDLKPFDGNWQPLHPDFDWVPRFNLEYLRDELLKKPMIPGFGYNPLEDNGIKIWAREWRNYPGLNVKELEIRRMRLELERYIGLDSQELEMRGRRHDYQRYVRVVNVMGNEPKPNHDDLAMLNGEIKKAVAKYKSSDIKRGKELEDFVNLTGVWAAPTNDTRKELSEEEQRMVNQTFPALKKLEKMDRSYDLNVWPGMYDGKDDLYYPKVSSSIQKAIREHKSWRKDNSTLVHQAEDPNNHEKVPKWIHRKLMDGEQLDFQAIRGLQTKLSMQCQKRGAQLGESRKQIESWKSLAQLVYDEIHADPTSGPIGARFFKDHLWAHKVINQEMYDNEAPIEAPMFPERKGEKNALFVRDDHWHRWLELQYEAAIALGKLNLRTEKWEDAIQEFANAKAYAKEIEFPPMSHKANLWQGIAWMGLGDWDKAELGFQRAFACKGIYREGHMAQPFVDKLQRTKKTLKFELWGRDRQVRDAVSEKSESWLPGGGGIANKIANAVKARVPNMFKTSEQDLDPMDGDATPDIEGKNNEQRLQEFEEVWKKENRKLERLGEDYPVVGPAKRRTAATSIYSAASKVESTRLM